MIEQLTYLLAKIKDFGDQRRANAKPHPLYSNAADPVPVIVTKIITAPWGMKEPITVPEECKLEIYWQAMPGEKQEDIDREFLAWIDSLATGSGLRSLSRRSSSLLRDGCPVQQSLPANLSSPSYRIAPHASWEKPPRSLELKGPATCTSSTPCLTPLLFFGAQEAETRMPPMNMSKLIHWSKPRKCCWSLFTNGVPPVEALPQRCFIAGNFLYSLDRFCYDDDYAWPLRIPGASVSAEFADSGGCVQYFFRHYHSLHYSVHY